MDRLSTKAKLAIAAVVFVSSPVLLLLSPLVFLFSLFAAPPALFGFVTWKFYLAFHVKGGQGNKARGQVATAARWTNGEDIHETERLQKAADNPDTNVAVGEDASRQDPGSIADDLVEEAERAARLEASNEAEWKTPKHPMRETEIKPSPSVEKSNEYNALDGAPSDLTAEIEEALDEAARKVNKNADGGLSGGFLDWAKNLPRSISNNGWTKSPSQNSIAEMA